MNLWCETDLSLLTPKQALLVILLRQGRPMSEAAAIVGIKNHNIDWHINQIRKRQNNPEYYAMSNPEYWDVSKLSEKEQQLRHYLLQDMPHTKIANIYSTNRTTIASMVYALRCRLVGYDIRNRRKNASLDAYTEKDAKGWDLSLLTDRQYQVVRLKQDGHSDSEIARMLNIQKGSVYKALTGAEQRQHHPGKYYYTHPSSWDMDLIMESEQDIVNMRLDGLSQSEIAERLFMAVSTVRLTITAIRERHYSRDITNKREF